MPKHPKPQILIDYENKKEPKICHTCEYYLDDGSCYIHKQEPPEDFAATSNICNDYLAGIPF